MNDPSVERRASSPVRPGGDARLSTAIISEVTLRKPCMRYSCRESAMAANALDRQLTHLEASRYLFGHDESAHVVKLLKSLDAACFADSASLIRFHEALLFLRAFPQGPSVVRATGRILNSFRNKVEALRKGSADMDDFEPIEVVHDGAAFA